MFPIPPSECFSFLINQHARSTTGFKIYITLRGQLHSESNALLMLWTENYNNTLKNTEIEEHFDWSLLQHFYYMLYYILCSARESEKKCCSRVVMGGKPCCCISKIDDIYYFSVLFFSSLALYMWGTEIQNKARRREDGSHWTSYFFLI